MSPTPGALLLGLAVAAPALWAALVQGTLPVEVALQRLVIILLVVSVVGSALRGLVRTYTRTARSGGHVGAGTERRETTGRGADDRHASGDKR